MRGGLNEDHIRLNKKTAGHIQAITVAGGLLAADKSGKLLNQAFETYSNPADHYVTQPLLTSMRSNPAVSVYSLLSQYVLTLDWALILPLL